MTKPIPLQRRACSFTAPIERQGGFEAYVTVPNSAEVLGTRHPVKVNGKEEAGTEATP